MMMLGSFLDMAGTASVSLCFFPPPSIRGEQEEYSLSSFSSATCRPFRLSALADVA